MNFGIDRLKNNKTQRVREQQNRKIMSDLIY